MKEGTDKRKISWLPFFSLDPSISLLGYEVNYIKFLFLNLSYKIQIQPCLHEMFIVIYTVSFQLMLRLHSWRASIN